MCCADQATPYIHEITYVRDHDSSSAVRKTADGVLRAFGMSNFEKFLIDSLCLRCETSIKLTKQVEP